MGTGRGPTSLLHVDDEPGSGELTSAMLEGAADQFVVETAVSAEEVFEMIAAQEFDCVVMEDGHTPGIGPVLVERVRERAPELPVVVQIGADGGASATTAIDRGATDYLRITSDATTPALLAHRIRAAIAAHDLNSDEERERILKELHNVATELPTYDNVDDICQRTVRAAESVLEFDNCVVFLADDDRMRVAAVSDEFPGSDFESLPRDDSVAGKTYVTGEPTIVGDVHSHPDANPQGPYDSGLSVPIGDHGTCQMISKQTDAFNEDDRELAELLVAHTEAALDRVAREGDLRRQNERLEEFASVVSHDLRNPLNVAKGHVQIVAEDTDSEHLDVAEDALDRMERLIEDLLTLAREGREDTETVPVSLADLCRNCWATVQTDDAALVVDADRTIMADSSRLRQLVENLIRNAIEHAGHDVTVTIEMCEDGFAVEDDGPGIPVEERESVFDSGFTTSRDGTGVGLSIVQEVADAHGWSLELTESEAGGARFEITGVEFVD